MYSQRLKFGLSKERGSEIKKREKEHPVIYAGESLFALHNLFELVGVAGEGHFKLAKGGGLHLTRVLESANPLGFLFLEACHLSLNLNSLLVLLVDSSD